MNIIELTSTQVFEQMYSRPVPMVAEVITKPDGILLAGQYLATAINSQTDLPREFQGRNARVLDENITMLKGANTLGNRAGVPIVEALPFDIGNRRSEFVIPQVCMRHTEGGSLIYFGYQRKDHPYKPHPLNSQSVSVFLCELGLPVRVEELWSAQRLSSGMSEARFFDVLLENAWLYDNNNMRKERADTEVSFLNNREQVVVKVGEEYRVFTG